MSSLDNQKPFVSVIMPTYNQADFIGEAIDSVLNQTYQNFELIVIDNYSDDKTEEIVNRYLDSDPRVKYTKFSNKGIIAASRNLGIKKACGELVSFIDSDDVWLPSKLDKQIRHFQDEEVIGVGAQALWMNGSLVSRKHFSQKGEYSDYRHSDFLLSNKAICSSVVIRKDVALDLQGFDESRDFLYIEDWELWLRVAQKGKFRILKDPLLLYRIQPNRSRQAVESSKRRFRVIDKHLSLGPIAKDDVEEAKANINLTIALNLIRLGDPENRCYFVKALKGASKFKTKLKAFGGYLLSILPTRLLKVLRLIFQNFKALGYRRIKIGSLS